MSAIFINYRHADTAWATYLDRRLSYWCGNDQVFRATRSILPGQRFPDKLLREAGSASVMLVVIGQGWETAAGPDGSRCLDDANDWVRREIAEALAHDVTIIPILVDRARFPEDLPAEISGMAVHQYLRLDDRNDDDAVTKLLGELIPTLPRGVVRSAGLTSRLLASRWPLAIAVLLVVSSASVTSAASTLALTSADAESPPEPQVDEPRRAEVGRDPKVTSPNTQWFLDLDTDQPPRSEGEIDFSFTCFPTEERCPFKSYTTLVILVRKKNGTEAIAVPTSMDPAGCLTASYPTDVLPDYVPLITGTTVCVRSPTKIAHLTFTQVPVGTDKRLFLYYRIRIWERGQR
jgi:hypothetical protein